MSDGETQKEPDEALTGLVSVDSPARVTSDGEVAAGWSDSGASSGNGQLASGGSPLCDSSDDIWSSGCGGGGASDGLQWSPLLVGSPPDTPEYFSGKPDSYSAPPPQRDGACAEEAEWEVAGAKGDDEGKEGRDEVLDDLARELDGISSDGEDGDFGEEEEEEEEEEESDVIMARAMQEEEWRRSPQSSPRTRDSYPPNFSVPKGFRRTPGGGGPSGAAASSSTHAAAAAAVKDALCCRGRDRRQGKERPSLPGISARRDDSKGVSAVATDALPAARASSYSAAAADGGGSSGGDRIKGRMEERMSQPPLRRQRQGKLPVWPPREEIEDGKGLPIAELPDEILEKIAGFGLMPRCVSKRIQRVRVKVVRKRVVTALESSAKIPTDKAEGIEGAIFALSGCFVGKSYKAKARELSFNLRDGRNDPLREAVLSGSLLPWVLVRMSSDELAPLSMRLERERIARRRIREVTSPRDSPHHTVTERFTCPECSHERTQYRTWRRKAIVDRVRVIIQCLQCRFSWEL